jgi:hypothetical protein
VHILYVMKNYMISSTDSHMDGWMDELINEWKVNFKVHICMFVVKLGIISLTDSHMDGWMDEWMNKWMKGKF